MALWELDEFQGPEFLGYVRNLPVDGAYLGRNYLPDTTTFDISVDYILGANRRPVMASVISYGSEAPIGGKPAMGDRVVMELPPIKRKEMIDEKSIIRFLTPRAGTPDKQTAIDDVYDATARLIGGVQARVEWLRIKALSEDTLAYSENDVIFSFDFGFNNEYQIDIPNDQDGDANDLSSTVGPAWSDTANATPIADLSWLCQKMQDETGFRPRRMVMRSTTYAYLLQNDAMRTLVRGSSAPTAQLSDGELSALLGQYNLPSIDVYDAVMVTEAANGTLTTANPLTSGTVVLMPGNEAELGWTLWGPTAEATRQLLGTPLASEAPGVFASTYGESEPPTEWIKASAVAFPSLPGANLVAQITAHA